MAVRCRVLYEGTPRWGQALRLPRPAEEAEEVLRLFAELVALEDAANE